MALSALLRARTAAAHARVDAAFGGFALGNAEGYLAFLLAHARALGAAEAWLARCEGLRPWRPRLPLLARDLADLRARLCPPLPFDLIPDEAHGWGVLYVLEGSRLGGALLARRAPVGAPSRYLSAAHRTGEWRAVRAALDAAAADRQREWSEAAAEAAVACFELFEAAAEATVPRHG